MANHNSSTGNSQKATNSVNLPHNWPPVSMDASSMHLPLHYTGGDLGLGNGGEPWIHFQDSVGSAYTTHSIEWVLENINWFKEGRGQTQLLAAAALHYGLGAYALMGADLDNMCDVWDVRDAAGRLLLAGVTHSEASNVANSYMQGPDWIGDVTIRRQCPDDAMRDPRHDGPLVLLHHNLGVTDFLGIAVKSHAGRCGMMLEEVLRRFDQFGPVDQSKLMLGLAKHFYMVQAQDEMAGAA